MIKVREAELGLTSVFDHARPIKGIASYHCIQNKDGAIETRVYTSEVLSRPMEAMVGCNTPTEPSMVEGAYYCVYYEAPPKYCIGRVLNPCTCEAIAVGHYRIKFLKSDALTGTFTWPCSEDIECVLLVWIFAGPVQLNGHDPFTVNDLDDIEAKFQVFRRSQAARSKF